MIEVAKLVRVAQQNQWNDSNIHVTFTDKSPSTAAHKQLSTRYQSAQSIIRAD